MLDQFILFSLVYLGLLYVVSSSIVRLFIGRLCRTSSWCLTTTLLVLSSVYYMLNGFDHGLYHAQWIPFVVIGINALCLSMMVGMLLNKLSGQRNGQTA